jgi:enoyl-CoA hydratase/carnithine racemase
MSLAQQLAAGPAEAMGIAKGLMNEAANMERLDYHLDREIENLTRIANGANFAEGLAAFFEKRAPRFNVPSEETRDDSERPVITPRR